MRANLLFLFVSVTAGCMEPIETDGNGNAPAPSSQDAATNVATDFDRAMMQTALTYKSFRRVNERSYTSTVGAFNINVYVHGDSRTYRGIHPETTGTAMVDIGTVIVREVLDANGQVAKLTMMAKGANGYDGTLGDWWFAEADSQGNPTKMGRLTECHSCHIPRAAEDYLFGVPQVDQ